MGRLMLRTFVVLLLLSLILWVGVASVCLLVGSRGVGVPEGGLGGEIVRVRLTDSVLPASLIGAGLAVAGVIYQALLRNPLADPYLLGVASGATLGKMLWTLPGFAAVPWLAATGQQTAAFVAALATIALVFALASRRGRLEPTTLLLTGVVVSALIGAVLLLLVALSRVISGAAFDLETVLMGGVPTNLTRTQLWVATVTILGGTGLAQLLAARLGVSSLSDGEAAALGLRLQRTRWVALGLASLITAAAVAMSGPIGFVGLVCPHLARLIVGGDPRKAVVVSASLGASLLAVADAASRLLSNERLLSTLLPTGVLTAMLGGPFFLVLLWRQRRKAELE
jgi:iron complex transport system permease protein